MNRTTQHEPRLTAKTFGAIGVCLLAIFITLHAAYPSVLATAKFLGYLLIFNWLPGLVAARAIFPKTDACPMFALAIGIVVNTLVAALLWSIGHLDRLYVLPALALGTAILRPLDLVEMFIGERANAKPLYWILTTLFLCFTALLGIGYINSNVYIDSFSMHAAFQGVIVRSLELGWPPPNLLLPGVAWSYNYAVHLWLLGAKCVTGLPIDTMVARYGPVSLGGASAALMLSFGRRVVGLRWSVAMLPVICVFWVIGIAPISGALFASFMPYGANLILSPFLSFLVFLLAVAFIAQERSATLFSLVVRILMIVVFAFLATGARGVCTPILLCALAFRWIISSWRKKSWLQQDLVDLVAGAIGFVAGLRFFFTVGTGFSGAGALKFTGQPFSFLSDPNQTVLTLAHTLQGWGVAALPAGIVGFFVIAVFQAGFLTPTLPFAIAKIPQRGNDADVLLVGSAIAGLAGFFLTEAPGLSHISFLYFASICLSLLGAKGLQEVAFMETKKLAWRLHTRELVLVAVALLVVLHLAQLPGRAIVWVFNNWSISALSLASASPKSPPRMDVCVKDEEANLFAFARRTSPASVVIVVSDNYCESFWWVVNSPVQIVSGYLLRYVPGGATDQEVQDRISRQKSRMEHALASASRGVLDLSDVLAIAETLPQGGPVFAIAERELSVEASSSLQMVGAEGAYALWKVVGPDQR